MQKTKQIPSFHFSYALLFLAFLFSARVGRCGSAANSDPHPLYTASDLTREVTRLYKDCAGSANPGSATLQGFLNGPGSFHDRYDVAVATLCGPPSDGRFGVSSAASLYSPFGIPDPQLLYKSAVDAALLGFHSFRFWADSSVQAIPQRMYSLLPNRVRQVQSLADLIQLDPFKSVLKLPFRTFFIIANPILPGKTADPQNPTKMILAAHNVYTLNREDLSRLPPAVLAAFQQEVYLQTRGLAGTLLHARPSGSGVVEYLGSNEIIWAVLPPTAQASPCQVIVTPGNPGLDTHACPPAADPLYIGYQVAKQNVLTYLRWQQQAIDDETAAQNRVGEVQHHCELAFLEPGNPNTIEAALNRGGIKHCDKVTLSAYYLYNSPTTNEPVAAGIAAANNTLSAVRVLGQIPGKNGRPVDTAISEIGLPQSLYSRPEYRAGLLRTVDTFYQYTTGEILSWNLNDNACNGTDAAGGCTHQVFYRNEAPGDLVGYGLRQLDATMGLYMGDLLSRLYYAPAQKVGYIGRTIYERYLFRAASPADQSGLLNAVTQGVGVAAFEDSIRPSAEAVPYRVARAYEEWFTRAPSQFELDSWSSYLRVTTPATFVQYLLDNFDEPRQVFINAAYNRVFGRGPTSSETATYLTVLRSGIPYPAVEDTLVGLYNQKHHP